MSNPSNKRLILILGGKGGTGKTLHCRQLYYFLVAAGRKCLAYDADVENPEFEEYHSQSEHKVAILNFLEVAEAKRLFTEVEREKPDVVLVDMPGASGKATREQLQRFGAFKLADSLGYRITVDTVLNNAYNTINSLDTMMAFCQERADYVAVKSQLFNQGSLNFDRWERSPTRQQFLQLQGIEIEMPVLEISTFDVLHERNLSFFEVGQLDFGDRILAESFLDHSRPQIALAETYLGLAATQAAVLGNGKKTAKPKAAGEGGHPETRSTEVVGSSGK